MAEGILLTYLSPIFYEAEWNFSSESYGDIAGSFPIWIAPGKEELENNLPSYLKKTYGKIIGFYSNETYSAEVNSGVALVKDLDTTIYIEEEYPIYNEPFFDPTPNKKEEQEKGLGKIIGFYSNETYSAEVNSGVTLIKDLDTTIYTEIEYPKYNEPFFDPIPNEQKPQEEKGLGKIIGSYSNETYSMEAISGVALIEDLDTTIYIEEKYPIYNEPYFSPIPNEQKPQEEESGLGKIIGFYSNETYSAEVNSGVTLIKDLDTTIYTEIEHLIYNEPYFNPIPNKKEEQEKGLGKIIGFYSNETYSAEVKNNK